MSNRKTRKKGVKSDLVYINQFLKYAVSKFYVFNRKNTTKRTEQLKSNTNKNKNCKTPGTKDDQHCSYVYL